MGEMANWAKWAGFGSAFYHKERKEHKGLPEVVLRSGVEHFVHASIKSILSRSDEPVPNDFFANIFGGSERSRRCLVFAGPLRVTQISADETQIAADFPGTPGNDANLA